MSEEKFNPAAFMRQLKGRGGGTSDYLDVKWRLVWLRSEHPEARVVTGPHTLSEQVAIFRAEVTIPDGGSATGWGSETPQDFKDYIEKAETKALGRALIALGYGTADAAADEAIDSAPIDRDDVPALRAKGNPPPAFTRPRPEPPPAPQPSALTGDQEKTIAEVWDKAEAGDTYGATKALVLTLKGAATEDEWREINRRWFAVRAKHYPMTISNAQPAANAG